MIRNAIHRFRVWLRNEPMEWDRYDPPDQIEWVDDFMREIQTKYQMYDKEFDEFHPIVYCEGLYIMDTYDLDDRIREYQDVSFWDGEGLNSIGDDHVYHNFWDAYTDFMKLSGKIPHDKEGIRILAFRHGDNDWATAVTIEESVVVNKLGWGIFVRRDLLEGLYKVNEIPTGDE